MDLTGQRIAGRYDIVRLLGEGGMGQVYEARHVELDKQVAIKFLFMELAEEEELLERFRREARITASLRHANIVEVMDFGVTDEDQPYLVMEYLTGESLSEILDREGKLSIPAATKIMTQILSGLSEAHGLGIVHRDLKPDNVFLDEVKGQGTVVKLLDFGISKITAKDSKENLELTKTGVVMGTPNYMSPEQVMGTIKLDGRADLYACGVMFFEMLTGRRPFEGETHNEVVVRIMSDPLPDMTSLRPEIGEELRALVLRALSRERDYRFATADELMQELTAIDPDQPPVSLTSLRLPPAPVIASRPPRWLVPAVAGGGALIVLVLLTVVIVALASKGKSKKDELITVTPRGAPEAAIVLHEGEELPGDQPFSLERGEDPVLLSVQAPGFQRAEFELVPDQDQQLRIHLLPLEKEREEAEADDTKKQERAVEPGQKPATGKKNPKKKKKSRNPFRQLFRSLK
jgi:serine/threonine protein kinase